MNWVERQTYPCDQITQTTGNHTGGLRRVVFAKELGSDVEESYQF